MTACTPENEQFVDEEICSQDDKPGTHTAARAIAEKLNVSHTSVKCLSVITGDNYGNKHAECYVNDFFSRLSFAMCVLIKYNILTSIIAHF